jgi:hypothetical protein
LLWRGAARRRIGVRRSSGETFPALIAPCSKITDSKDLRIFGKVALKYE